VLLMSAAVYLAHQIEWNHAKARAALLTDRRRGQWARLPKAERERRAMVEFDAHAATELADLIERTMRPAGGKP
jgi:hypothetical protein